MNLETAQEYVLAALMPENTVSVFKKEKNSVCLAAACLWDMFYAEIIDLDECGKIRITADLPAQFRYCRFLYEQLKNQNPATPEKVMMDYAMAVSAKRIIALADGIVETLLEKRALTPVSEGGLRKTILYHVNRSFLMNNPTALYSDKEPCDCNCLMLSVLLLQSGLAKKILSKEEVKQLIKTVRKQDTDGVKPDLIKMITAVEQSISAVVVSAVTTGMLTN